MNRLAVGDRVILTDEAALSFPRLLGRQSHRGVVIKIMDRWRISIQRDNVVMADIWNASFWRLDTTQDPARGRGNHDAMVVV